MSTKGSANKKGKWREVYGKIQPFIGIGLLCVSIWCVHTVVECSYANKWQTVIAYLALIAWGVWTVFTIDEKRRDRELEKTGVVLKYSRWTDGFPDDFKKFCADHKIGDEEGFARYAIKKEMARMEKEDRA